MFRAALRRVPFTLTQAITRKVQPIELKNGTFLSNVVNCERQFIHSKVYDKDISRIARSGPLNEVDEEQKHRIGGEDNKSFLNADPDVFGTGVEGDDEVDPADIEDEENRNIRPKRSQKLTVKQYSFIIKEHLTSNRIKEAIDVLEVRMVKEDRVQPDTYIYNLLISGCAKAGYSKKAFQLYNKMKQRGLRVTGGTYTSLYNACANSPWPLDGLNKANRMREIMIEKGYTPNLVNYNAMIKAFGRCGDVQTAYLLVDEMLEKKLAVNTETFNFLLQACASEADYGYRHALLTWHKMHRRNINPDIYSFSLMLRCVRDCSMGDLETMQEVLGTILENPHDKTLHIETQRNVDLLNAGDSENNAQSLVTTTNSSSKALLDETPNLLTTSPHLGSLVALGEVTKPEDRLLLLGGFTGFLDEMKKYNITPGIETFTALLEVIPPTLAAEKKLIAMIRKIGLKSDIDFFNVLIKKRSMRFDYDSAREVLSMIKTAKLQPDIVTYGVLSLSCKSQEQARELLHEMRSKGIRMNIQIIGAMLRQGCAQRNFAYVHEILQLSLEENIRPNEQFLQHLDRFTNQCTLLMQKRHPTTKENNFKHDFNHFKQKLNLWYEEHDIAGLQLADAVKRIKGAPFKQFQEQQPTGFEETKNEKFVKKQKIRKFIRKIKMRDLKEEGSEENNKSNVVF